MSVPFVQNDVSSFFPLRAPGLCFKEATRSPRTVESDSSNVEMASPKVFGKRKTGPSGKRRYEEESASEGYATQFHKVVHFHLLHHHAP